jgi:methyltransferase (TIGR00027 family)
MQNQASASALTAAAARAAHLIVDHQPYVFADTLAERLLGERADELINYHRLHGDHLVLAGARAQVTVRSRLTEELIGESGQYVILGAGLDSFAYRSRRAIDVFEVDHPASQADKRERVAALKEEPERPVGYVPVDLETGELLGPLRDAGFDLTRPAVVSWLGVSMYLTPEAAAHTLTQLAALAPGTRLILDHMLPAAERDETGQAYVDAVSAHTAGQGEPWIGFYTPEEMADLLGRHGFGRVRSRGQDETLGRRTDALRPSRLAMVTDAVLLS